MALSPKFSRAAARGAGENLRFPTALLTFEFKPSVGIVAKDMLKFGMDIRSFKVPLTRSVRQVMMPSIAHNFDVEGRPPWEPLEDATLQNRADAGFPDGPILDRSGKLRNVATAFKIWKIGTAAAAVVGLPGAEYGTVHQGGYGSQETFGQKRARMGLSAGDMLREINDKIKHAMATGTSLHESNIWVPARPFIQIQTEDEEAIKKIFADWLVERALKHGFIPLP